MKAISEHVIYRKYYKRGGNPTPTGSISNINKNKATVRIWSNNKNMILRCSLPLCFAQYWIYSTKFESVVF